MVEEQSFLWSATVATQRRGKHISAATNSDTIDELCFLCCPCRVVITGTVWGNYVYLVARVLIWKSCCGEKTLCVIFGVIHSDCYSSCVKIRCQETDSGDCNRLGTLVCVCQWSVKCSHASWVYEYKWLINLFTNPNFVYSHSYAWPYEWSCLLGCTAVWFGETPTVQRSILPPSSWPKSKRSKRLSEVDIRLRFLARFTLRSWKWRQYLPPKRRTVSKLRSFIT
jgi:hypothetical protein